MNSVKLSHCALVLGLVIAGCLSSAMAAEGHPHIRAALRELEGARTELKEAADDFGGHKADAIGAVDTAITQLRTALESVKAPPGAEPAAAPAEAGVKHPHIHAALTELRESRNALEKAAHDFGGHRAEAIDAVDNAIKQLKLALESAKK